VAIFPPTRCTRIGVHYGSVRLPVFVRHRLPSLDLPMRPESAGRFRKNPGSLNFLARCVSACQGHRPRRTPTQLAMALGRMLPSGRRHPEAGGISRLNNLARSSSCLRFVSGLTPVPQNSEPASLARPSPYDSFIRYVLPVRCYSIVPLCPLVLPAEVRCLRTGLTL
jgi:hypothetical protein